MLALATVSALGPDAYVVAQDWGGIVLLHIVIWQAVKPKTIIAHLWQLGCLFPPLYSFPLPAILMLVGVFFSCFIVGNGYLYPCC